VHESLVSGVRGPAADTPDVVEDEGDGGGEKRPNPFAALEALKRDGDKNH
jgi:uncharacterized protein